ncbi:MAG: XRE family transcriptional regulator [Pseudomonadota bacterium]
MAAVAALQPVSEAAQVGARIREARKSKQLKLRDLSVATGLSVPHLSKLENGKARLTVELALEMCTVLGVPATYFFMTPQATPRNRRSVTRAGAGVMHQTPGVSFEVLCSDLADKQALHWRVTVRTTPEDVGEWRSHAGEEFIHVLSGQLQLQTQGYEPLQLGPGDSITFDGEMPHRYVALGATPAVLLMANAVQGQTPALGD